MGKRSECIFLLCLIYYSYDPKQVVIAVSHVKICDPEEELIANEIHVLHLFQSCHFCIDCALAYSVMDKQSSQQIAHGPNDDRLYSLQDQQ